jgi:hypothetical protein
MPAPAILGAASLGALVPASAPAPTVTIAAAMLTDFVLVEASAFLQVEAGDFIPVESGDFILVDAR